MSIGSTNKNRTCILCFFTSFFPIKSLSFLLLSQIHCTFKQSWPAMIGNKEKEKVFYHSGLIRKITNPLERPDDFLTWQVPFWKPPGRDETLSLSYTHLQPVSCNSRLTQGDCRSLEGREIEVSTQGSSSNSFPKPCHGSKAQRPSCSPPSPTPKLKNEPGRTRGVSIKAEQNPKLCVVAGWGFSSPLSLFPSSPRPPPSPSWEEVW